MKPFINCINLFLLLISMNANAQKKKVYGIKELFDGKEEKYFYTKQLGKKTVIKDTGDVMFFQSDSACLRVSPATLKFVGERYASKYRSYKSSIDTPDSLIRLLFENGFITGDLLRKSHDKQQKELNPTMDFTPSDTAFKKDTVMVYLIKECKLPAVDKGKAVFEIWIEDREHHRIINIFHLSINKNSQSPYIKDWIKSAKPRAIIYSGSSRRFVSA